MYQIIPEGLESLEHKYGEKGSEKKAVKKKERKWCWWDIKVYNELVRLNFF